MPEQKFLTEQYQSSSNLEARIQLHERFSTNNHDWSLWVFDRFALPTSSRILELGCGTGRLWRENLNRIPPNWSITLSDSSTGMLEKASQNLAQANNKFQFELFDAHTIPFENESFDAVVANHMFYHVADLQRTLSEIKRVLKPSGQLYAATNGESNMKEIGEICQGFDPSINILPNDDKHFSLENGADQLAHQFTDIKLHLYESNLVVTEAEALTAYILSSMTAKIPDERQKAFSEYVKQLLQKHNGSIFIQKHTGLFVANIAQDHLTPN